MVRPDYRSQDLSVASVENAGSVPMVIRLNGHASST
jgi:hypothetical protein